MLTAALRVIRADLRSRPLHTALAALVVTLHGRATLADPFDRLFAATHGAHVTAVADSAAGAARLARLPGVAQAEPPRPLVQVPVRRGGREARLGLAGLAAAGANVERPVVLQGRAARGPGELLL